MRHNGFLQGSPFSRGASVLTAPEVWASLVIFGGLSLKGGSARGAGLVCLVGAVLVVPWLIGRALSAPRSSAEEGRACPRGLPPALVRSGAGILLGILAVAAAGARFARTEAPPVTALDADGVVRLSGSLVDDLRPGSTPLRRVEVDLHRVGDHRGWEGDARGRVVIFWRGSEYLSTGTRRVIPLRGDGLDVSGLEGLERLQGQEGKVVLWVSEDQIALRPGGGGVAVRRRLRQWIRGRLARLDALGGPLILALLLGDRGALSQDLSLAVRSAGASHALALSGMHVGVLALILYAGPARFLPHPVRGLAVFPFLAAYVWVAGWIPSLVRALVLIGLISLARLRGRKTPLPVLLARTVCLVALVAPEIVRNVGFQLSLLALAGILAVSPPVVDLLARCMPRWCARYAGVSLAAMIATAPISWFSFGTIYPAGIICAGLLSSVVVLIMWCGLSFLVVATLPGLGSLLVVLISWLSRLLLWLAGLGGMIPQVVRRGDSFLPSGGVSGEILIPGAIIAGVTGCIMGYLCLRRNQFRGSQLQKESIHEPQLDF
ncbi:ComEC/Rec2 family competence protein [Alkalispirochaeta alkalica]|uniref:ComEC/Rec2 family competence protein n=1 Tax=Alkalispirochaeta alkalica TaxID=46356 RepID=UPI00037521B1|nr:ComEC/Rec2 family competence protein [Alkalispirochaeta alkalica]